MCKGTEKVGGVLFRTASKEVLSLATIDMGTTKKRCLRCIVIVLVHRR